jgi:hypothetical protein
MSQPLLCFVVSVPFNFNEMSIDLLLRQVRETIEHVGWQDNILTFGGISMVGAYVFIMERVKVECTLQIYFILQ